MKKEGKLPSPGENNRVRGGTNKGYTIRLSTEGERAKRVIEWAVIHLTGETA